MQLSPFWYFLLTIKKTKEWGHDTVHLKATILMPNPKDNLRNKNKVTKLWLSLKVGPEGRPFELELLPSLHRYLPKTYREPIVSVGFAGPGLDRFKDNPLTFYLQVPPWSRFNLEGVPGLTKNRITEVRQQAVRDQTDAEELSKIVTNPREHPWGEKCPDGMLKITLHRELLHVI